MQRRARLLSVSRLMVAFLFSIGASQLLAQLPSSQLGSIFPSGGKPGQVVEVTIAGLDLDDANQLLFSHPGITAKQKMAEPGPFDKGPVVVANTFEVTIAANVPLGSHDVRAIGKYGVSNPRAFRVGDLAEAVEAEPNNDPEQATEITLPIVVNGQANAAADVDCYKFTAAAGQRILVECHARRIDSQLDPVVAVYDSAGREMDSSRDGQSGDPVVDFTVPANGDYWVKIHDSLFRGNAGNLYYFYRLGIGVLPHVDFVFPPAGLPGSRPFTVFGRNLPGGQAAGLMIDGKPLQKLTVNIPVPAAGTLNFHSRMDPEVAGQDGVAYRVKAPAGLSNAVLVGVASANVLLEAEPNNDASKPQKVVVPCEVAGQFFPNRDTDWFEFEAKKGDVFSIEVISQRLGLPTDPSLLVQQVTKDAEGKEQIRQLAFVDDPPPPAGVMPEFNAAHDDPLYRLTAPADATYRVLVRDSYSTNVDDPRNVYRLAIRPETPDFRLAAAPDGNSPGVLLRKGGSKAIRVVAYKRDGFAEPITVSATGMPAGVTCPSVTIGPGRDSATLVLTAADNAAPATGLLRVTGTAKVGAANVTREARAGHVIWPLPPRANNQPQMTGEARVSRGIAVSVSELESAPVTITAGGGKVWETSRAGIIKIPYTLVRRNNFKGNVVLTPSDLPANVTAAAVTANGNTAAGEFQVALKANTPVGTYTINLDGLAQNVSYIRNPEAAKAAADRKVEIDKINVEKAAAAKAALTAKQAADKAATDATNAVNAAVAAKAAADKAAADAEAAVKAATDKLNAAKAAAAKTPGDAGLAAAVVAAQNVVNDTTTKAKTATDAVTAAQKALDDANAKAKVADDAKVVADKANEEADALAKAAVAAKAAADKLATDTANAAKAANRNVRVPSTPVTISIAPAPITMVANAPATPLKQGEKLEIPITITRLFNYAGAVTVAPVVQGVGGLQIPNASIPAGQTATKFVISAAANATPGEHELIARATVPLNGQNVIVDVPFKLSIMKVEPAK